MHIIKLSNSVKRQKRSQIKFFFQKKIYENLFVRKGVKSIDYDSQVTFLLSSCASYQILRPVGEKQMSPTDFKYVGSDLGHIRLQREDYMSPSG